MTEIINWLRKTQIYVVHTSAFKPRDFYFNNLQAATDFFNNLILFIGVKHSSGDEMMADLYDPSMIKDFSTLSFYKPYSDIKPTIKFYTKTKESNEILYQGTLTPPYADGSVKGPDYRDYLGIWKGRGYLPVVIGKEEDHAFNQNSQVTFITGWWLETLMGTYEVSLGKINIDE